MRVHVSHQTRNIHKETALIGFNHKWTVEAWWENRLRVTHAEFFGSDQKETRFGRGTLPTYHGRDCTEAIGWRAQLLISVIKKRENEGKTYGDYCQGHTHTHKTNVTSFFICWHLNKSDLIIVVSLWLCSIWIAFKDLCVENTDFCWWVITCWPVPLED